MRRKRPLDPWVSHIDLVKEVDTLMTQVEALQKQVASVAAQATKGIQECAVLTAAGIEDLHQRLCKIEGPSPDITPEENH